MGPTRAILAGNRHHFQHGPIDLTIDVEGEPAAVHAALAGAWASFQTVLPALVSELRQLRRPLHEQPQVEGRVARRMLAAAARHPGVFLTPMAAVAGAVADEMIEHFQRQGILRACVNNGGDMALHLAPGQRYRIGLARALPAPAGANDLLDGAVQIAHDDPVRGVATSGWRGRSFSFGIADSVTVLAASGADADVAATLIANAVNVDSAAVTRRPAAQIKDDTDLGDRLVTVAVGLLSEREIGEALDNGLRTAQRMRSDGRVQGAALFLAGRSRVLGDAAFAA